MRSATNNRQARRSRTAFLQAFNELVLTRGYNDIRVGDIIRKADAGRSTFYEHFRNKDDLLRQSMSHILSILADAVSETCDLQKLRWVLEHFRENVRLARSLANGPSWPRIVALLADLIEERLNIANTGRFRRGGLPVQLAAAQIAESQFGLVRAWLNEGTCSSDRIARALHVSSMALVVAWKETRQG